MHDLLRGSFKDLGIVKVIGFNSADKLWLIRNVQFSSGKIVTLFYSVETRELHAEE